MGGNRKFRNEANNQDKSDESSDSESERSIIDHTEIYEEENDQQNNGNVENDISKNKGNKSYGTRSRLDIQHTQLTEDKIRTRRIKLKVTDDNENNSSTSTNFKSNDDISNKLKSNLNSTKLFETSRIMQNNTETVTTPLNFSDDSSEEAEISFKIHPNSCEFEEEEDGEILENPADTSLPKSNRKRNKSVPKSSVESKRSKQTEVIQKRRRSSSRSRENERSLVERCKSDPEIQRIVKNMVTEQISEQFNKRQKLDKTNKTGSLSQTNEIGNNTNQIEMIPAKIKSPSQSTLYTPAVRKSANFHNRDSPIFNEVDGMVQYEDTRKRVSMGGNPFSVHDINNILTDIRFDTERQRSAVDDGQRPSTSRDVQEPQPSTSRGGSRQGMMSQARTAAHEAVIQAEKFKASIQPRGMNYNNQTSPVQKRGINFNNPMSPRHERLQMMHLRYLDDDDDFFHVSCHIDKAIIAKIERGEFIDLEKLLQKKTLLEPNNDKRLQLVNRDGESYFVPSVDKETKINNVKKWEQAFRVYTTVYCKANPERSAEILQYADVINRAAQIFSWDNVAKYDYVFRQLMAAKPYRSWAKTYTQMWNMTLNEPIKKFQENNSSNVSNNRNHNNNKKDNTCWRFNKNTCKFGSKCRFEHRCSYCGTMNHSALNCHKRLNNQKKNETSSKRQGGGNTSSSSS